tara:strand:+ start:690 stop:926 length:237 start_codon:yes stop_codon:yes gene_type:complete
MKKDTEILKICKTRAELERYILKEYLEGSRLLKQELIDKGASDDISLAWIEVFDYVDKVVTKDVKKKGDLIPLNKEEK